MRLEVPAIMLPWKNWGYIFLKVCKSSFKGPIYLAGLADEARKKHGELKDPKEEEYLTLDTFLTGKIQPMIDSFHEHFEDEINAELKREFQHYLNHLKWELHEKRESQFAPHQLFPYLTHVKTAHDNTRYFTEPMLRILAITAYNLELRKPEEKQESKKS